MLAGVKWHIYLLGVQGSIQSVLNLIIGHPCYGQLTAAKKGTADQCHKTYQGSGVQFVELTCFIKFFAN